MSKDLTETKVSEEFVRADGRCACETCGMLYFDHPSALEYLDWQGNPYLRRLCNGKLVKL